MTKASLRIWARQTRANLDMTALSEVIARNLVRHPRVQQARNICLYLPLPGEVEVERLIPLRNAVGAVPNWYVPRCAANRRLAIHPYHHDKTPLQVSVWGIREPDPMHTPEVEPDVLDLVIVPALLLTSDGGRLGYGGGYYDRFLPRLPAGCATIGALPSPLIVPDLPLAPWDVPLKGVVSERKVQTFDF